MPNLLRVRTVFTYGAGSPGLMTQYFGNELGDYNEADAQVAVNRVRDAMLTSPNLWPTAFQWEVSGDVDIIQEADGEVVDALGVDLASGAGTSTNEFGPLPVGVLLRSRTDTFVDGRRLVGRTYFVPVQNEIVNVPAPDSGTRTAVAAIGDALNDAGLTLLFPYVWSRPRPATAVGPGRPAGPARSARAGSSARATQFSCSPKFVVLTSRRD